MIGYHTRQRHPGNHHDCPVTHDNLLFARNMRNLGYTWRKIATELGLSLGTIKSAYFRWKNSLD